MFERKTSENLSNVNEKFQQKNIDLATKWKIENIRKIPKLHTNSNKIII